MALFSQIPGDVLRRINPIQEEKIEKFYDSGEDGNDGESTSTLIDTDICEFEFNEPNPKQKTQDKKPNPKKPIKSVARAAQDKAAKKRKLTIVETGFSHPPTPSPSPPKSDPHTDIHKTKYSDAIVQADSRPELVDRSVQTDETQQTLLLKEENYQRWQKQGQFNGDMYKPIYSVLKSDSEPPLKIGLTKKRGVKREVFYPGDRD